jgi:hypothetical protein
MARRGKRSRATGKGRPPAVERISLEAPADRVAAEALALEIRHLVRRLGVGVRSVRVEPGGLDAAPPEAT